MAPVLLREFGVVVGGFITYLVATASERQRRSSEMQDRLNEAKRQGLVVALRWLDPMERALIRASGLISSCLHGNFQHSEFMREWPHLLGDLTEHDIPVEFRVLVPDSVYGTGHKIVRALDELRSLGVRLGQEVEARGLAPERFHESSNKLDEIRSFMEALRRELSAAYVATYQ